MEDIESIEFLRNELLIWHDPNARYLPWKDNNDPYSIWLSEIILQQTRVEQGTPYYLKFIENFPTVKDLALAEEDKVLQLWEGLGYYSRARNLHFSAKYIYNELNGEFPKTYTEILKLKGVGPYTAAAISSFAYGKVKAVVDGNVIRVLSRYFGITDFVDETITKKRIQFLADICISDKHPASYNQAIMDFGATVCSPKVPACLNCTMNSKCQAYLYDRVDEIPSKAKKIKKRNRYFHFIIINNGTKIIIEKRGEKDIWQGLYQYPMIEKENEEALSRIELEEQLNIFGLGPNLIMRTDDKLYKQTLTHQYIFAKFYHFNVNECINENSIPFYLVELENLKNFAFPKIINAYSLENNV